MKNVAKKWILVASIIIGISFLASGSVLSFSGSSGEGEGGLPEPPWGLAISSNADGVKLTGTAFIEYIQWTYNGPGGSDDADLARVVLRLSRGNNSQSNNDNGQSNDNFGKHNGSQLAIFYDEIPGPLQPMDLPNVVQNLIMTKMSAQVIEAFFPGETGLEVTVRRMENFIGVYGTAFIPRDAVTPVYGSCSTENVITCDAATDPGCDPSDPSLYTDIVSCDGDIEFCGNGIDDDGDLKVDYGGDFPYLRDPDCLRKSVYSVFDVELAVK